MKKMYAVTWYDEVDSTNNEAIRKAGSLDNMSVIAASHQTAGRGQRGNAWHAEAGENLTFSIFLRFRTPSDDREGSFPEIMAADQFVLSETATLAQCRFLKRKPYRNDSFISFIFFLFPLNLLCLYEYRTDC